MAKDMYVVVSERDTCDPFDSNGSIIYETYVRDSSLYEAEKRVQNLAGRFGQCKIFKLVPVKDEIDAEVDGGTS